MSEETNRHKDDMVDGQPSSFYNKVSQANKLPDGNP